MNCWIFLLCAFVSVNCAPRIKIEQGEVIGSYEKLSNGRILYAFKGIPYAKPPIGKLRFKEPQPPEPWVAVWNASTLPSPCLQLHQFNYTYMGEEDCLYLNIFTPHLPKKNDDKLMDVLVYIHGGAFMYGSGTSAVPAYILKNHDIVYVGLNYRLNAFGFFSTDDFSIPGNNGLKDQVAALKWVQRNIQNFGGNPDRVTILGCSAGGASVHYHFLSPLSEGLFHRGISLSGSVLPVWTLPKQNAKMSSRVAQFLSCPLSPVADMIKCLRNRPAKQIIEATFNLHTWRSYPFTTIGPTVEPSSPNAFLAEEPIKLLDNRKIKNLPWLIALCKDEGLYPASDFVNKDKYMKELEEKWLDIAPHLLMFNFSSPIEEKDRISEQIKRYYFGEKSVSKKTAKELVQLLGDRFFNNEIIRAAKLHAFATKQYVYSYFFSYRGKHSQTEVYGDNTENLGVSHADDLNYILNILSFSSEETESDRAMVDVMSNIMANFMKTGNPNISGITWQPVSKDRNEGSINLLHIRSPSELEMEVYDNTKTLTFWKQLLPVEYSESKEFVKSEL